MQGTELRLTQRSRIARVIRNIGTGWLFVIAGVITFVTAAGLFVLHGWISALMGVPPDQKWSVLEGVMGLLTVALLMGGGLFALAEYIEGEEARRIAEAEQQQAEEERMRAEEERMKAEQERIKQQSFSLYTSLVERLMNNDEIEIRRWIIRAVPILTPDSDYEAWIAEVRTVLFRNPDSSSPPNHGQKCVKSVLNTFDYLGFVALNYWELDAPLLDWLYPMVSKVWERIGPYVEEEARRRHEPNYYQWARKFGERCLEWRASKNLSDPRFVEDAL
jgi:hypothetical protein